MDGCDQVQGLLGRFLDGDLDEAAAAAVREHLAACGECADLKDTLDLIAATITPVRNLEPPAQLAADIAASPCRRWLGLLFSAIDREISEPNLARLLSHLESCEGCRRAWIDLSLVHQTREALTPPAGLLGRCIAVRRQPRVRQPVLNRRVATAAAYALAVLASLTIGNPVSIARSPAVQRVAESFTSEIGGVAMESRGELRVMVWRAWQWGQRQLDAARALLPFEQSKQDSDPEQGDPS